MGINAPVNVNLWIAKPRLHFHMNDTIKEQYTMIELER